MTFASRSLTRAARRTALVVLTSVALLTACGGGVGAPRPTSSGIDRISLFTPDSDGFAFPNFTSTATPEVFDEADLVTMFGKSSDVCIGGLDPCVLTAEAAGWARMINDARTSGLCEGFAVLAAARFRANEQPSTVELTNEGDVTHALMRAFATQFFHETVGEAKKTLKRSLRDKVAMLESALARNEVGDVLGVYGDIGGHGVLPYAVRYLTPDVAQILVYDPNWPGQERFVTVDMANDTWTFAFSGSDPANDLNAWTGNARKLAIAPFDKRMAGTCPFCGGDTVARQTLLVVRSVATDWTVTTPDGVLSPTANVVGDAQAQPIRSLGTDATITEPHAYLVSVPAGTPLTVMLPSSTRVTGVTASTAIQIETDGSNAPVEVATDNLATSDPGTLLTLADGDLVATSNGFNNTVATDGKRITVTVDGADGIPVEAAANATSRAIEVRTPGRDDVSSDVKYEVVTQVTPDQLETRTTGVDGTKQLVSMPGVLPNTRVYIEPSNDLPSADVESDLPPATQRALDRPSVQSTISLSSTTTSTTSKSLSTEASRPTTTRPQNTPTTVGSIRTSIPTTSSPPAARPAGPSTSTANSISTTTTEVDDGESEPDPREDLPTTTVVDVGDKESGDKESGDDENESSPTTEKTVANQKPVFVKVSCSGYTTNLTTKPSTTFTLVLGISDPDGVVAKISLQGSTPEGYESYKATAIDGTKYTYKIAKNTSNQYGTGVIAVATDNVGATTKFAFSANTTTCP